MYDATIGVKRTGNGYTVTVRDPEIVESNRKDKGPYHDPELEFVFETAKETGAFVTKAIDKLQSMESQYETAFAKALRDESNGA